MILAGNLQGWDGKKLLLLYKRANVSILYFQIFLRARSNTVHLQTNIKYKKTTKTQERKKGRRRKNTARHTAIANLEYEKTKLKQQAKVDKKDMYSSLQ